MRLGTTSLSVTKPGPRRRRFLGIYTLSSASSVNEGDSLTVNINTVGVPSGTVLYWQTTNITTSDSDFTATSGSAQIVNGAGGFTIPVAADSTTEGAETFGITLRRYSQSGPIVASTTNKTINDTSQSPPPPSYSASSPSSVNEGSALVCTVTTTNVADSTTLYWTTSHTSTTAADFTANSGSFTITSNSGTFNVTPTADTTTEGAETFTVQIRTGSVSGTIVATLPSVTVNDTSLTPSGWDINSATYVKTSNIATASPSGFITRGLAFKPDGTQMYVVLSSNYYSRIYQYNLSTAWDVNTLTANGYRQFIQDRGYSVAFKPDGIRYFLASDDEDRVQEYDLDTAWDIDGGETFNGNTSFQTQDTRITSCQFSSDGTKMVLYGATNDKLYYFTLSTAWDVSTASYSTASSALSGNGDTMAMKPDGTKFYLIAGSTVSQHNATTAFDMSTVSTSATYTLDVSNDVSVTYIAGIALSSDGSKLYTINRSNRYVYQYDL